MKKNDIIQKSDNTKVNIGTAELPRWKAPFVPDYGRGQAEYSAGNYSDPHAKAYAEKISGKVESVSPEFEILTALGLKGLSKILTKPRKYVGDLLESSSKDEAKNIVENTTKNAFNLPSYARPNSSLQDAGRYHHTRLVNGGYERKVGKPYDKDYVEHLFTPVDYKDSKALQNIANKFKTRVNGSPTNANMANRKLGIPGDNDRRSFTIMDSDRVKNKYTPEQFETITSHEVHHGLDRLAGKIPKARGFADNRDPYLSISSELAARGTQLKNYFGLYDDSQKITGDMLRYAAKNYVKDTGINNNMKSFFSYITDFDKAADWLSKVATVYGGTTMINKGTNNEK